MREVLAETNLSYVFKEGSYVTKETRSDLFKRELGILQQVSGQRGFPTLTRSSKRKSSFTTKYIPGETLQGILAKPNLPEVSFALKLSLAVTSILATLHDGHQVVHNDLSTQQIIVSGRKEDPEVTLIDFGLSFGRSEAVHPALRRGGQDLFLSPEKINERMPFSEKTDIFSLGTIIHLMFEGDWPFSFLEERDYLAKMLTESPKPSKRAPAAVGFLVHAMLEKTPEDRPSANEVKLALKAI